MELVNHTTFPAALFRGVIGDDLLYGSLLARITYDLVHGELVLSQEQPWIVSGPPWESEYGPMPSDELFYKGGVDLFVFGHARAWKGKAIAQSEVNIEINSFRRRVMVFGDRVWQRRGNDLVPSAPKPFTAMPLTMASAFGGTDVWDELPIPFQDNPDGKGYYLEEQNAVGKPLPNLEDPDQLIRNWDDRPDPVGLGPCPMTCGLRARESIVIDEQGLMKQLKPTFFNAAFPNMIVPCIEPGDRLRLSGVSERGIVEFTIPRTRLSIRLRFDEQVIESPLAIDQVGIEVDKQRVFLAYRYPFKYQFFALQKRSCELLSM
jgi:hypothetical protein